MIVYTSTYVAANGIILLFFMAEVAQMVKNPPAMQETQVQSLSWDDPLEKEMTTHSSVLAWDYIYIYLSIHLSMDI